MFWSDYTIPVLVLHNQNFAILFYFIEGKV